MDDGSPVDVIYLDFQKAFDKVTHQRLILKLKSHGMGNSVINWIEQWLTDRRQRVVVDGEVSSWKSVLSGVPQGSVLGPILFLVYINDLEEGVTGNILKFADDTKLFSKTKEIGDKKNLQDDIDKLVKWSEKWQMLFNFGKCKCLHIGPGNTSMNYEMGGTILSTTVKEKDLRVTMNANMKVSEQCRIAASKGNQVLGMIRRNITYKENSLIVPLYKAIVRPQLEYCIQAWSPYLRKDIDMLEKIQRRATKLIPELRDLRYEERLKECGLTTLETRRLRGHQIEVFKILNGYANIDSNIFFEIKKYIFRGHNFPRITSHNALYLRLDPILHFHVTFVTLEFCPLFDVILMSICFAVSLSFVFLSSCCGTYETLTRRVLCIMCPNHLSLRLRTSSINEVSPVISRRWLRVFII